MTKFCLALAAGALLASPAAAQSPVTTYPTTSAPVVGTPQTYGPTAYGSQVYSSPAAVTADETPVRRGLFARIRARREARSTPVPASNYGPVYGTSSFSPSSYGAPAMTTTPGTIITPPPSTATPSTTTPAVPMQMPGRMSMGTPTDWTATSMSMTMPATGMQTVTVDGMAYTVPANLPPEGVVVSERIITPTTGMMDRNVVMPASGTVVVPGVVTPATYTIPVRPMPMPR